jgi:hypothetical protein
MAVCGKIFRNRHFFCLQNPFCLINFFTWAGDSNRPATEKTKMTAMILNKANGQMERPVTDQSDMEVLGNRHWASHLTIDQMRKQIAWEQSPEFKRK